MKENYHTTIVGQKVQLVPYRRKFVEKYNDWMKDPYILEMTASEPLTLDEEFDMQKSWVDDPYKCTFIILSRELDYASISGGRGSDDEEVTRMAGDVNLFMNDHDDKGIAEIEVMVAEQSFRKKGYAKEAIMIMMCYGLKLNIWKFFAKINETNTTSINLFKSLGFIEVNYVAAFKEYEYEFLVGANSNKELVEERVEQFINIKDYVDAE